MHSLERKSNSDKAVLSIAKEFDSLQTKPKKSIVERKNCFFLTQKPLLLRVLIEPLKELI